MNHPSLLIIRNSKQNLPDIKKLLLPKKYGLTEVPENADIELFFQREHPDLVLICCYRKQVGGSLEVVDHIRRQNRRIPIILLTKHSSESRAIAALRAGVTDYFKIPYSGAELLACFDRHLSNGNARRGAVSEPSAACSLQQQPLIGDSKPMREIAAYMAKIAATDSTVLITGETGTGKELVAERIHCNSLRCLRPFISINCAALPENLVESELFGFDRGAFTGAVAAKKGKFEQAQGGTVFLDEIGDMSLYSQAKILRCIENKEVYPIGSNQVIPLDIRIIAATNQEPEELLSGGNFRQDLYYRLNIARIHLPPLRNRKEDIPRLVAYAIKKLNFQFNRNIKGLTKEALACLLRCNWPGNIRELMNLLEASYINLPAGPICRMDLPEPILQQLQPTPSDNEAERSRILSALLATNWNKSTAARNLKWSRMTLYRKIAKYKIVEKRNPAR
jgi:DNA-binding NtrC family response regulator